MRAVAALTSLAGVAILSGCTEDVRSPTATDPSASVQATADDRDLPINSPLPNVQLLAR